MISFTTGFPDISKVKEQIDTYINNRKNPKLERSKLFNRAGVMALPKDGYEKADIRFNMFINYDDIERNKDSKNNIKVVVSALLDNGKYTNEENPDFNVKNFSYNEFMRMGNSDWIQGVGIQGIEELDNWDDGTGVLDKSAESVYNAIKLYPDEKDADFNTIRDKIAEELNARKGTDDYDSITNKLHALFDANFEDVYYVFGDTIDWKSKQTPKPIDYKKVAEKFLKYTKIKLKHKDRGSKINHTENDAKNNIRRTLSKSSPYNDDDVMSNLFKGAELDKGINMLQDLLDCVISKEDVFNIFSEVKDEKIMTTLIMLFSVEDLSDIDDYDVRKAVKEMEKVIEK